LFFKLGVASNLNVGHKVFIPKCVMTHVTARLAKEGPPEEDWWVPEDMADIVETCIERVAHLPRGQKGRIYRECIQEGLGGRS